MNKAKNKPKKYKVVVDYGKPYELTFNSLQEMKKELIRLGEFAESGDCAYCDVWIYDEDENDISDEIFKKLGLSD